jgi:hypothetical protein
VSEASPPDNSESFQLDYQHRLLEKLLEHDVLKSQLTDNELDVLRNSLQQHHLQNDVIDIFEKLHKLLEKQLSDGVNEKQQLEVIHEKSYMAVKALIEQTDHMQHTFSDDSRAIQKCRERMTAIQQKLHEKLDYLVTEQSLNILESAMQVSWTSKAFNQQIARYLKNWSDMLDELSLQIHEHRNALHQLYSRVKQHNAIGVIQPKPYSMQARIFEYEQIREQALGYSGSLKLALKSSSSLASDFCEKIGKQLITLFEETREEISDWIETSLHPLSLQIEDQRDMLDRKLAELDSAINSREQLEQHLASLARQQQRLQANLTHIHHFLETARQNVSQ